MSLLVEKIERDDRVRILTVPLEYRGAPDTRACVSRARRVLFQNAIAFENIE